MMTRKMKQLALAVGIALGGAAMQQPAQAVNVSADNLGQTLIFPYYTVRGGWNTLLHVTNTSDQWVAVRTRFREAYNSRDVMDFIVVLSPHDWWGATVLNGSGDNPHLVISDDENTCVVGLTSKDNAFPAPASYVGDFNDGGPETVERLRSGYVEMIMMGASTTESEFPSVVGKDGHTCQGWKDLFRGIVGSQKNVSGAVDILDGFFSDYPSNTLKGQFSLVNLTAGLNAGGLPTALSYFRTAPVITLQLPPAADVSYDISWHEPSLNSATTPGVYVGPASAIVTPSNYAAAGAPAVSAALESAAILNEWTRNATGAGGNFITATDWVVTFPTKNFWVDGTNASDNEYSGRNRFRRPAIPPFPRNSPFSSRFEDGKSCDSITPAVYDRAESIVGVEVPSPSASGFQLCYEANVLTFNQGQILQDPNPVLINFEDFLYGWMQLTFSPANNHGGLPAVGFAISTRDYPSTFLSEAALYNHSIVRPVTTTTNSLIE